MADTKRKAGMGSHQSPGRGERVWLTPPEIVKALGPFDLDPCFGAPRPCDTAATHYGPDAADGLGGLAADWFGRVWCNPPYDRHAWEWLRRCAEHGDAIALVFARTEVAEFHRQVWERATAALFLEGRLYFHHGTGERAAHNGGAPSVLVAYGEAAAATLARCGLRGQFIRLRGGGDAAND